MPVMPPGFKIQELHVFVITEDDGTEGVPAMLQPSGVIMPLVAADPARLASLIPMARVISHQQKKPVMLRKYSAFEVVDVIGKEFA